MKVNLKQNLIAKLRKSLDENIELNEIINDFIINYLDIVDKDSILDYKEENNITLSNAYLEFFKYVYSTKFNIDFVKLDEEKYLNNEYVKNIKIDNFNENNYKLEYISYLSLQPILCDNITLNNLSENIKIGYFENDTIFKSLTLSYKDNIWMNITPHEIKTMEQSINNAFGNCLVYGLGLGYYIYMISNKENVKKITVIEKDKNIIDLFNKYIFPLFKNKDKIIIINDDCMTYNNFNNIDYCFIDIYRDTNDGLPIYLELKEKENHNIVYDYWIEDSMLIIIRRYLILKIINEKINDKVSDSIYKLFENYEINDLDDLNLNNIKHYINKKCME